MKIFTGIFDHMVMQRDSNNFSCQKIEGKTDANLEVVAKCYNEKGNVIGESKSTSTNDGTFILIIDKLPVGGPYNIIISASNDDSIAFDDILVGDVWVLAGQSNMKGWGNLTNQPTPDYMVRGFYMDDVWAIAKEPLHNIDYAKASVHWNIRGLDPQKYVPDANPIKGVGPGVYFGIELFRKIGVPQGLIACSHGGTRMDQWDPDKKNLGNDSLYGAMYNRFVKNGAKVRGLLWYQGCSDCQNNLISTYKEKTKEFFEAVRKDFEDENLPILMVQLATMVNIPNVDADWCYTSVRESQRLLSWEVENLYLIPALDLELDDVIHVSGRGHRILGRRLAEAALNAINHPTAGVPPIKGNDITTSENIPYQERTVTVTFNNVVGNLHSNNTIPRGFNLHFPKRFNLEPIKPYKVVLNGNQAVLSFQPAHNLTTVSYGFGCANGGNICDEAGRAIPAFGPIKFRNLPLATEFVPEALVSEPYFDNLKFEDITSDFPNNLAYEKVARYGNFIMPQRLENQSYIRFIKWKVNVKVEKNYRLSFGSDGPFKFYLDDQVIYEDSTTTTPLIIDNYKAEKVLTQGVHEFKVAFKVNNGYAWGISFKLVDIDIFEDDSLSDEVLDMLPKFCL